MATSLSPNEIVRRLREELGSPFRLFRLRSGNRIVGRLRQGRFWVRYSTFYNNGMQRLLTLQIEPVAMGTRLRGELRCSIPTLVLGSLWFAFVILFNFLWLLQILQDEQMSAKNWDWMNLIPLGMLIFGVLLFRFGIWLSSLTEPKVIEFIEQTLEAR